MNVGIRRLVILGIALTVAALHVSQAQAALYWSSGTDVGRANIDGSVFNSRFVKTEARSSCGLEVDSDHVYWADRYEGKIGRSNIDGSGVEEGFISSPEDLPCDIAVGSEFLYWTNWASDTIGRARLDGSDVETDFISTVEHPCGIAADSSALYWTSDQEGEIWKSDLDGLKAPEMLADGLVTPCGITMNDQFLFWTEGDLGSISSARLDGSEQVSNFITGGDLPSDLEIDDRHIYWINAGWGSKSIGRANLDGTDTDHRFISGLEFPYALALDSRFVDAPPALSAKRSTFKIGKIKHNKQEGIAFLAVDIYGIGDLKASVRGAKARVLPVMGPPVVNPLRRWLRISPRLGRTGAARCIHYALSRFGVVRLRLSISLSEPGGEPVVKEKEVTLKKGRSSSRVRRPSMGRVVGCDRMDPRR